MYQRFVSAEIYRDNNNNSNNRSDRTAAFSKSEYRIRNNRLRRKRELKKHIALCLLTILLVMGLSSLFFGLRTKAQSKDDAVLYKYYKSIMVEEGDTLWGYAGQYGDESHYRGSEDYIREVMNMNALSDDRITAGQFLILPYYSSEFVE